jgi:uncharacterized protein YkwD
LTSQSGILRVLFLLTLALAVVGCSSTSTVQVRLPETDDDEDKEITTALHCQSPENEEHLVTVLFERIQTEREVEGLPPLVLNDTLNEVAETYACKMADEGFFDHIDPETKSSPGQRVTESGYEFISVGENLAAGQRSVDDVIEQWMASAGHRANILGTAWRETGIGVRLGGDFGVYWVQVFADPLEMEEVGAHGFVDLIH